MDAGYPSVEMRPVGPGDHAAIEALLDAEVAGRHQVRLGERVDVLEGDGWALWAAARGGGAGRRRTGEHHALAGHHQRQRGRAPVHDELVLERAL